MRIISRTKGGCPTASILALGAFSAAISCTFASSAHATVLDDDDFVNAAANIYQVGGDTNGYAPVIVDVTGISAITVTVPTTVNINGAPGPNTITVNASTLNDADGVGAATASSSNTGSGGIAGVSAPYAGYLAGVFVGPTVSATAPTGLSFNTTDFTSLSPLLQQAFFIGDGLTGDGSGQIQTFYVPTGATRLVLGISDACGYNGSPGCYGDNFGSFKDVTVSGTPSSVSAVPLPDAAPMFGAALLVLGAFGYGLKQKNKPIA